MVLSYNGSVPVITGVEYKQAYPFGEDYSGTVVRPVSPRVIPASDSCITSPEHLFALACAPGIKIVEVPDAPHLNWCLAYIFTTALNSYQPRDRNAAILATGGTWDPPRMLMGNRRYAQQMLGAALPTGRGIIFSCLDEYGYNQADLERLIGQVGGIQVFLGGKQNPILYGDLHRLFLQQAGFTEADFLFPPAGFIGEGAEAAARWRDQLKAYVYPAVICAHGMGTFPYHDAFNDLSMFSTITGWMPIADSTKFQNGNDTQPPGAEPMSFMFRNIASAYSLRDADRIFTKAISLVQESMRTGRVPGPLRHYVSECEWNRFILNSDGLYDITDKIMAARAITARMPSMVISQGLSDLIDGGGAGRSADSHVFGVGGGHKAEGFLHCACMPPDERNPASALNMYGNVIIFVESKAATFAHRYVPRFCDAQFWRFEPGSDLQEKIEKGCTGSAIADRFWQDRNPELEHWQDH